MHLVRRVVEAQLPDHHGLRRLRAAGRGPPQHGADPGVELRRTERLDHIVVGAGSSTSTMTSSPPRAVATTTGTWLTARIIRSRILAVDVGQPEVEYHQIGSGVDYGLQGGHAGGGARHHVAKVDEGTDQGTTNLRVVLHQEEFGHDASVPDRICHRDRALFRLA